MSELFGFTDMLNWARDESDLLDFNVFPSYAVIKVKAEPEMIWLVRDGMPLTDDLLAVILGSYFQENYKKPLPEAA